MTNNIMGLIFVGFFFGSGWALMIYDFVKERRGRRANEQKADHGDAASDR